MELHAAVFAIGLAAGGLSGLLGIGGGIVAAPLLLYLPPALGMAPLSMHHVAGLTVSQALFASVAGGFSHWRADAVDRRLAAVMSGAIFAASLAGGAGARYFSHRFLLGVFLALAAAAAALMLAPRAGGGTGERARGEFSTAGATAIALGVGLLGGLVGQGGSFILIPLMTALLGVPLRTAMATNLVVVFFAAVAGFAGKAATGQVPPGPALALLAGVLPGTLLGVRLTGRASTRALRAGLAAVILAACVRMAVDLLR